ALWTGGGPGRVDDRGGVVFVLLNGRGRRVRLLANKGVPVGPTVRGDSVRPRVGGDPVHDSLEVRTDPIDDAGVFVIAEDGGHARVVDDVLVIRGDQAIVERHEDSANLRDTVVALEEVVRVGTKDADAVARLYAEGKKGVPELVCAGLEIGIGHAQVAIDD